MDLEDFWKSKTIEKITEKSPGREYLFLVLSKATQTRTPFFTTLSFGNQNFSSIWSWFPYHLLEVEVRQEDAPLVRHRGDREAVESVTEGGRRRQVKRRKLTRDDLLSVRT